MTAILWLLLFAAVLAAWLLAPSTGLLAALCVFIAAPLLSWLLLFPLRRRQNILLRAPSVTTKGQAVPLTILLPRCKLPLGSALVWIEVENTVTGQVLRRKLRLSHEATWNLESCFCGGLRCRVIRVWALDLFGLLPLPLPCRGEKKITVMPNTFPVEVDDALSITRSDDCQEYAPDRRGQDMSETFQIRDYVPGDNLHQIHWKLSGKTGQLLVREASCPVDHSLVLLVERRQDNVSPRLADALMEAVISVCQSLVEAGKPFYLMWNETQLRQFAIGSEAQLPEAAASLLQSPIDEKGLSAAALYLHSDLTAGRILYFCHQLPSTEELPSENTQIYLCAEEPCSGENIIAFTPENMTDVLRRLEGGGLQ